MLPSPSVQDEIEALERDIDAMFRAASRRAAEHAGRTARELRLEALAGRYFAEAAALEEKEAGQPRPAVECTATVPLP